MRAAIDPDATVTAGNASGQNDGAAMCIVTTPEGPAELGLKPLARLVSWAAAGVPPRHGHRPGARDRAALERAGLTLADIDLIELNEAFAAQVLAVTREWGFDRRRLRPPERQRLGHLARPPGRRDRRRASWRRCCARWTAASARYGLETMCIGGGQGLAAVFERVA